MLRSGSLILLAVISTVGKASGPFESIGSRDQVVMELRSISFDVEGANGEGEPVRLVSSGLALLLGPFAAHRLYLGTSPKVAIIYGLTFGGFGVLVLLDLGHLLFTKDLDRYRNSDRVFMWAKPEGDPAPDPTPP